MKKGYVLIFLAILLVFSSTTVFANGQSDEAQTGKTLVTMNIMGTDVQRNLLDKWIPIFEEENPDIEVEYEVLDWGTGKTKILTKFAGGLGADIVMAYGSDIPQYIENGALSSIDEYFDPSPFSDTAYSLGSWNGSQYAIPWVTKIMGYYYRTDKFEEAGLDPAMPPRTWEELVRISKKLTKRDASGNLIQNGMWVTTSHTWKTLGQYCVFLWSAGGRIFSEDGSKTVVNSSIGVATAEMLRDMLHVHKVDEPGSILNESIDFAQGKMASGVSNNAPRGMEITNPENMKYVAIAAAPSMNGTTPGFVEVGGDFIGISSTSKNRDAAAKLLKFMTETPELVVQACMESFGPPALHAAVESFSEKNRLANDWFELINSNSKVQPLHPRWGEIQSILTKALDDIYLAKNSDAKSILDDTAKKLDRILLESGPAGGE